MLSNLRNLYSKSVDLIKQVQDQVQSKPVSSSSSSTSAVPINLRPSSEVLARHEKQWDQIVLNGASVSNIVAAQDVKIKALNERCESEVSSWNNLQIELNSIGSIVDSVDSLRAEMEALCGQLEHLDLALDEHLKAKEQRDLNRWKKDINRDTDNFHTSRARELSNFERTLKSEQSKRIRQKAEEDSRALKEAENLKRKEARVRLEEEQRKAAENLSGTRNEGQISSAADSVEAKKDDGADKTASDILQHENEKVPLTALEKAGNEEKSAGATDDNELEVNDEVLSALEEK